MPGRSYRALSTQGAACEAGISGLLMMSFSWIVLEFDGQLAVLYKFAARLAGSGGLDVSPCCITCCDGNTGCTRKMWVDNREVTDILRR